MAVACVLIVWIWGLATVDSADGMRDVDKAGALTCSAIVALAIAIFVARYRSVAMRLKSWIVVPVVGSAFFMLLAFGAVYLMGGFNHLDLADLAKMQLVGTIFFALMSAPFILFFRVLFVGISYLFGVRSSSLK